MRSALFCLCSVLEEAPVIVASGANIGVGVRRGCPEHDAVGFYTQMCVGRCLVEGCAGHATMGTLNVFFYLVHMIGMPHAMRLYLLDA
jgi:hypothetical protein